MLEKLVFLQTLVYDLDPSVFSLTFLLAPCIELKLWGQKVAIYGMVTNISLRQGVLFLCAL